MRLPEEFEKKMKNMLGDEYDDYIKSYEYPKYQGIRINPLKLDMEKWMEINPFTTLKPVPWCKEGFYYDASEKPAKHPYYFAGLYYIQEPSAMSPGAYLPIEPGDKILDMCAAPGGKSTQIGSRMQGEGVLVSNDISPSRVKALLKNVENFGITNSIVTSETSEKLASKWHHYFDKILIDAPCSGEGMFRKNENAAKSWEAYGVEHCANLQRIILEDSAHLLKMNGMILYSTCTFSPEENEGMINEFLQKHPDFKVIPLEPVGGIQHGRPELIGADESLKGALRLWPHHLEGEGHFLCLLQRTNDVEDEPAPKVKHKRIKDYPYAKEFIETYTNLDVNLPVIEAGQRLYLLPEEAPDLSGIRTIRGGLLLGELKNKRFEPSHSLSIAYPKEMYKNTIEWNSDDENVKRYLKGETIIYDNLPKGYYVICIDGFPLGWVKAIQGKLKNEYPASWRLC